ncbi:glycosyltransferase [Paraburkholderia tropica]|uniref:glycosyltransferase n=1 Tax=Paraburkholderia tropica TaxID=92647 RepID=UPI002AB01E40|nr:glycosyltransferase [Paraburkholderia tropica]
MIVKKILHVTEALAGGVLHCVSLLANEQARAGHDVTLVYSVRLDTPSEEALAGMFDSSIRRIVLPMKREIGFSDFLSAVSLWKILRKGKFDAIHSHSSKAGALARLVAFMRHEIKRSCYSPHGFAFLRRDVSEKKRRFFHFIERALHRLGGKIAACSVTEKLYAEQYLGQRRVYLLENAIDTALIKDATRVKRNPCVRVVTAGRVAYQKAPWRFAQIARHVAEDEAEFVWFGDGDDVSKAEWLGDSRVSVSGWLDKRRLIAELAESDVFVLTSLWEGMPIALIEAQAMGIPAVATNIVGNKDVVVHGKTGFLADTDEELLFYTAKLANDSKLRQRMSNAARRYAIGRFSKDRFLKESVSIYFGA